MGDASMLFSAESLSVGYTGVVARVDWKVQEGDFWVIRGPNGCGKSTLIKTILGLLPKLGGRLNWNYRPAFGYIPQSVGMHPSVNLKVRDFILMGRRALQESLIGSKARNRVAGQEERHITSVRQHLGLEGIMEQNFWDLSGGQQRRAILARTLLVEPDLLLVDEPSSGLDRPSAAQFFRELDRLHKQEEKSIIVVSHEDHYLQDLQGLKYLDFQEGEPLGDTMSAVSGEAGAWPEASRREEIRSTGEQTSAGRFIPAG